MGQLYEFKEKISDSRWKDARANYENGRYDKALELFESLAEDGFAGAYYYLGNIFEIGKGGVTQDLDRARYWYMRAIDTFDDEYSYIGMARLALKGYEDAGSIADAVQYLEKVCDKNNPVGLTILGTLYHAGKGVPTDSIKAAQFYERAIAQGHVLPMAYLSKLKLQNGRYLSGLYWHFKTIWTAYRIARKNSNDVRLWNYIKK